MDGFIDLILFFSIYSFLGWMMETIFASVKDGKLINRGFLTGFFCPVYGVSSILILRSSIWVNKVSNNYFQSIIIGIVFSIILVTLLEYITGLLLQKIFNNKWWDYSDNRFNFQGHICLKYSLIWGLMAYILVKFISPEISGAVFYIPISTRKYFAAFLFMYFLIDTAKSVTDALDLREVIMNYSKFPVSVYEEKVIQYKRFFLTFPSLLIMNAGIINRDVRSIINEKIYKIKDQLKSRFQ